MTKNKKRKGLNTSSLDLYDHIFDQACDEVNLEFIDDPFCGNLWRDICQTKNLKDKLKNTDL